MRVRTPLTSRCGTKMFLRRIVHFISSRKGWFFSCLNDPKVNWTYHAVVNAEHRCCYCNPREKVLNIFFYVIFYYIVMVKLYSSIFPNISLVRLSAIKPMAAVISVPNVLIPAYQFEWFHLSEFQFQIAVLSGLLALPRLFFAHPSTAFSRKTRLFCSYVFPRLILGTFLLGTFCVYFYFFYIEFVRGI